MSLDKKSKVYGLIIPKKPGEASKAAKNISATIKRPSIFNDDSSDDDAAPTDWRKRSVAELGQAKVKKQTKLEMNRALQVINVSLSLTVLQCLLF